MTNGPLSYLKFHPLIISGDYLSSLELSTPSEAWVKKLLTHVKINSNNTGGSAVTNNLFLIA